ncbi:UDP-N-acetylmuramoyl-L-alanine--D-glutamate ligase [Lacibacter sediminis]|uniref:UDP-N-acetylmuramoylalanine--D-glutamate ligase n=1 Tax=Lacibacter sediminis TaxID=2760713 RepID=A0A7G5XE28_9BACT|nr:UDP-N-acetylmuramoyl-L-alanine--D-glutamate ligase [Lacibacter sediminis]QNA43731.1 UDP-N-acetylmuramoyl-L-alanine--D-glutamate ligase [Lacibacter sediminis]
MAHKCYILGGGESGAGAAILAKKQGYDVFVSDAGPIKNIYKEELKEYGIEFEESVHSEEKILSADEIVKSPGIPEKSEMMKKIRKQGIPVISEVELAYRFKGNSKIVAITGSNGKTTTTSLTYHICKHAGVDCALVGNIGISIAKQVAIDPKEVYIAELSSFQLDDIKEFKAEIAVLTNITEDHLDRYEYRFENYINAKFKITNNQTKDDFFIYCADDPVTAKYLKKLTLQSTPLPFTMKQEPQKGAFIKDGTMTIAVNDDKVTMSVDDFKIKGKHNQYNTMAAGIAASTLGIRKEKIREAVTTFESLEHRMEMVAMVKGVEYINDSKATNINSTWYALESMTHPTILILGGVDKGNDYEVLKELVKEKVKAIVCLGLDNRKIHEAFGDTVSLIVNTTSAEDAVRAAYHFAEKGDAVLLSPACASFDLFKNYEDRGNQFKQAVRDL